MKKFFSLVYLCSALIISGCATQYKSDGFSGGYSETQLDVDVWRIIVRGNGVTRSDRVEDFAILRSAELALKNGFTHFTFINFKSGADVTTITEPETKTTSVNGNVYGNNLYAKATTTTSGGDSYTVVKPNTVSTVLMFHGKPNIKSLVYDALFICDSLGKKYEVICNKPKS